ncbi:DAG protein, chloroplastic [Apostasia shenzhenica]|uniref:DAG protein, chloroplastic n=1 Tax=Apostasia shenzhenica TaxID=1088818 RepID=A0A2I0BEZ8_9ASPA|nr:DAG protein, chloroplastic [Apostasia shenzhenica]
MALFLCLRRARPVSSSLLSFRYFSSISFSNLSPLPLSEPRSPTAFHHGNHYLRGFSQIQSSSFHSSILCSDRRNDGGQESKIGPDEILFEGCDYNHWLITMDFPKDPKPTPEEMVETYVQTLAKVVGSVEEAKKRMYACSTTTYTGFQAVMTEEMSEKFRGLPGVVFILPDSYIDPVNKEYGGDKYDNGLITPRPPPIQYGRQGRYGDRNRSYDQPRYDRQRSPPQMQGGGQYGNPQPMQAGGQPMQYGNPQPMQGGSQPLQYGNPQPMQYRNPQPTPGGGQPNPYGNPLPQQGNVPYGQRGPTQGHGGDYGPPQQNYGPPPQDGRGQYNPTGGIQGYPHQQQGNTQVQPGSQSYYNQGPFGDGRNYSPQNNYGQPAQDGRAPGTQGGERFGQVGERRD